MIKKRTGYLYLTTLNIFFTGISEILQPVSSPNSMTLLGAGLAGGIIGNSQVAPVIAVQVVNIIFKGRYVAAGIVIQVFSPVYPYNKTRDGFILNSTGAR